MGVHTESCRCATDRLSHCSRPSLCDPASMEQERMMRRLKMRDKEGKIYLSGGGIFDGSGEVEAKIVVGRGREEIMYPSKSGQGCGMCFLPFDRGAGVMIHPKYGVPPCSLLCYHLNQRIHHRFSQGLCDFYRHWPFSHAWRDWRAVEAFRHMVSSMLEIGPAHAPRPAISWGKPRARGRQRRGGFLLSD